MVLKKLSVLLSLLILWCGQRVCAQQYGTAVTPYLFNTSMAIILDPSIAVRMAFAGQSYNFAWLLYLDQLSWYRAGLTPIPPALKDYWDLVVISGSPTADFTTTFQLPILAYFYVNRYHYMRAFQDTQNVIKNYYYLGNIWERATYDMYLRNPEVLATFIYLEPRPYSYPMNILEFLPQPLRHQYYMYYLKYKWYGNSGIWLPY